MPHYLELSNRRNSSPFASFSPKNSEVSVKDLLKSADSNNFETFNIFEQRSLSIKSDMSEIQEELKEVVEQIQEETLDVKVSRESRNLSLGLKQDAHLPVAKKKGNPSVFGEHIKTGALLSDSGEEKANAEKGLMEKIQMRKSGQFEEKAEARKSGLEKKLKLSFDARELVDSLQDALAILAIAYHNMAVETEYLGALFVFNSSLTLPFKQVFYIMNA